MKISNIAFANVSCKGNSQIENLASIAIVAGDKKFFETLSYANNVETVKEKLSEWILSFEETVFINTTRQKEIEVIKELLKDTKALEQIKIKVYLKMLFQDMFSELRTKGLSLLRISFLYDLSQKQFENSFERFYEEEATNGQSLYAVNLEDLKLAKANYKALLETLNYLKSLPDGSDDN